MLQLDLNELERRGSLAIEAEIPPDAALLEGAELDVAEGTTLVVEGTASRTGSGQVLVRGILRAALAKQCRRCLKDLPVDFREEFAVLFAPPEEVDPEEDHEIRPLEPDGSRLDLSDAIREEVVLVAPTYFLCREDCRGLCPQCGVDLNETDCDCTFEARDPRWDALRALKED